MSRSPRHPLALLLREIIGVAMSEQYFSRGSRPVSLSRNEEQINVPLPERAHLLHDRPVAGHEVIVSQILQSKGRIVQIVRRAAVVEERPELT